MLKLVKNNAGIRQVNNIENNKTWRRKCYTVPQIVKTNIENAGDMAWQLLRLNKGENKNEHMDNEFKG